MSKYIDADKLKDMLRSGSDELADGFTWKEIWKLQEVVIDSIPAADVVPMSTLEQIKWERDCFEQQIREIGGEPFMKWECTDLAHVVRCKDCIFFGTDGDGEYCDNWNGCCRTHENGFCHDAVKDVTE